MGIEIKTVCVSPFRPRCRYLDVIDGLIDRYRLRPATVCGAVGLNDYRCVAFVWGSAQLAGAADDEWPSLAAGPLDETAARRYRNSSVWAKCVDAVHRRERDEWAGARRRPVWLHSYQLWNATGPPGGWDRVNVRLAAAFRRNALDRFHVVGRLLFGELLRFAADPRPPGVSFYDRVRAAAADGEPCSTRTEWSRDEAEEQP